MGKRAETYRLKRLTRIESQVREAGYEHVAGVDEAGRGPLAGPVVAAACQLPIGYTLSGINDSKKLTGQKRYSLYRELVLHPEIRMGIGVVEASEIDRLNIHVATLEAMRRAVERLLSRPDFLLIDGAHIPEVSIPADCLVDGDRKSHAIAAASILAKVTRDHIMIGYDELYPGYGFKEHKGYGTEKHLKALREKGPCPIHRYTFRGVKND